jgi:hypothetical protein
LSISTHCQAHTLFICWDVKDHKEESVFFFQPHVVSLPQTMNFILKPLLHNAKLFRLYRKVLKETMLKVITSSNNNNKALASSDILQTLVVKYVAKEEISRVFDRLPLTCRNKHKFNQIMSNGRALQMKWL